MASTPLCIICPINSPLFIHVRLAHERFYKHRNRVALVYTSDDATTGVPSDFLIAESLKAQNFKNAVGDVYRPVGGICDPHPAICNNLRIAASVVKRLALLLLSNPHQALNASSLRAYPIAAINAHGPHSDGLQPRRPQSSAQVLSRVMAKVFDPKAKMGGYSFGQQLPLEMGRLSITISADFLAAARASNQGEAAVVPAPVLFPEWSRLLLSALVWNPNVDDEASLRRTTQFELLKDFVVALEMACQHIHYDLGQTGLIEVLRSFYAGYEAECPLVAKWLLENRFVPNNVACSRFALLANYGLWTKRLSRFLLLNTAVRDAVFGDLQKATMSIGRKVHADVQQSGFRLPSCLSEVTNHFQLARIARWLEDIMPQYIQHVTTRATENEGEPWLSCITGRVGDVEHRFYPAIELLLKSHFGDANYKDSQRGGNPRPDFPLVFGKLALEVKYIRAGRSNTEVHGEIGKAMYQTLEQHGFGLLVLLYEEDALPANWKALNDLVKLYAPRFMHILCRVRRLQPSKGKRGAIASDVQPIEDVRGRGSENV